jgi:hypothetical protein
MGGMAEPVLKHVAQISDGWFPQFQPGDEASHTLDRVRAYVKEAGRPLSAVGIEGRFTHGIGGPAEWVKAREGVARSGRHAPAGEHDGLRPVPARPHRRDPEDEGGARRGVKRARAACYRVHNDWLLDFCKAASSRRGASATRLKVKPHCPPRGSRAGGAGRG